MKTAFLLITVIITGLMVGCGGETAEEAPADPSDEVISVDTLELSVTDTIGIEMGDSAFVFGMLMQVGHGSDGSIIALDMQKACLSVFSPQGEFIGYIGAPGPGPGEFQVPLDFAAFPDGSIAVTDAIARCLSFFDPDWNYTHMMSGFFPAPPMSIEGGPGGSIIGEHMPMVIMGEEMEASLELSMWTDSTEAEVTYVSTPMEMHFAGGGSAEVQRSPEFDFAIGPDGDVIVAEISDTLFSLQGFTPEGEEFLSMTREMERTPMTQEEIDAGALGLSIMITDGSANAGTERMENTYPWRNIIGSVGVDSQERIWVELAYTDLPTFEVYDYSGELQFVAVVDNGFTPVTRPAFRVDTGGLIAWDQDPMDYPKIFLLEMP